MEIATVMERVMEKGVALTKVAVEDVNPDVARRNGDELFRVLAGLTSGEANTIVKGVATQKGMSGRQNGLRALKLLEHRFNPKTPARRYRALMEVISPGEIKAVADVTRKVEEWEVKMCKVESEYGERISDSIRVAVLISMIPKELQDIALQMGKLGEDIAYQEVKEKIMAVASNKAGMRVPKEGKGIYDVGWDMGGWDGEDSWDYEEVNAMGKGT